MRTLSIWAVGSGSFIEKAQLVVARDGSWDGEGNGGTGRGQTGDLTRGQVLAVVEP